MLLIYKKKYYFKNRIDINLIYTEKIYFHSGISLSNSTVDL